MRREALEVMVEAYDRMGLKELRDDSKKVLAKNYPRGSAHRAGEEPHEAGLVAVLEVTRCWRAGCGLPLQRCSRCFSSYAAF